jgi:hypothetical protein
MRECPLGLSFAKYHFQHTIMPTMVSSQKDIKRYHRALGHMILVILILVGHIKKCACVRLNHLCVLINSVLVVVSANLTQASSDTPLALTKESGPRVQHRVLP